MVVSSEPLDLSGGRVRGRRHRQAAASGHNKHQANIQQPVVCDVLSTARCYHRFIFCHVQQNLTFVFDSFRRPNVSRTSTSRGRGSCRKHMRFQTWCSAAWETRCSARCCPRASEQHNTHSTVCLCLRDSFLSPPLSSSSCCLTSWSSWSSVRSLCPVTWRRNGWCFLVFSLCPTPPCWRFWVRPLTRTLYR